MKHHPFRGRLLTVNEIAAALGVSPNTVWGRLRQGTPLDAPPKQPSTLTHNGRTQTLVQWAEEIGVDPCTLSYRLKQGWPMERVLSTPSRQARPTAPSHKPRKLIPYAGFDRREW